MKQYAILAFSGFMAAAIGLGATPAAARASADAPPATAAAMPADGVRVAGGKRRWRHHRRFNRRFNRHHRHRMPVRLRSHHRPDRGIKVCFVQNPDWRWNDERPHYSCYYKRRWNH